MPSPLALVWDLIAKDSASPAFLRVAGAADKTAGSTLRAQKNVETMSARMSVAGAKLTKGLTLPLVGLAAVSVDQAAKYQKALNTVAVATDKTAAQTAQAGKGLESIAKSTGTSLSQLTDSYYTAAKSGKSVADSLAIVKAASQGAKAEGADLGTVTDALTSIMASYGKSLGTPVQAMNAIVRGAGLAKTNIGDFSASLSNVVPVASALHISFAQVAGAIDTMTQHGETAQRATENLANLITNLAGQNGVASKSLQALNVDTIDLSKNLGKRGLTGSLDVVLAAIAKHGKDGLVVTSAFKQSALATAGLQSELKAMPPALKAQSEAFDKGSISFKDYNAYVKSLGGQQYQLGKGFISTEAQAKGFASQLTSGNSTVRTLASTLQKALGGVTGMRTALMLSGQSAATFAADTKAVSDASKRVGGDVLGWATTQGTLAVKLDKAKESMQVMAVEIGTALLPTVGKIVDAVAKAVGWFDSLSSGDKKFLGWSAVVLAAIGPVLSIFGRVASVLRLLPGLFAKAGESAALSGTRIGAGLATTGKVVAGVQGGAIGGYLGSSLVASQVNGSSTKGAVGTVLGGAAGGAALGAFGGPVGAAIGGVAGAAVGVVTAFNHMGDAAKASKKAAVAALNAQKAAAADLLSTLQSVSGAYNDQYRQNVTSKLDSSGALQIGDKAGLKAGQLTNAVIGTGGPKALAALNVQLENAAAAGKISFSQLAKVQGVIQQMAPAATSAETALERQNRELGKGVLTAGQVGTSYAKLKAALAGTGASLDTQTAAGQRNNAILAQNVQAMNATVATQLKAKVPLSQVAQSYVSQIGALTKNSVALGANRADVEALIGKYANVPKSVLTQIEQHGIGVISPELISILGLYKQIPKSKATTVGVHDHASGTLQNIHDAVNNIPSSKTVTVYSRLVGTSAGSTSAAKTPNGTVSGGIIIGTGKGNGKAAGGTIRGPGGPTSDSVLMWGSNGEEVINAKQSAKYRGLLKAINAGVGGFASGGTVGSSAAAKLGKTPKSFKGPDGQEYASQRAATNALTRAQNALAKELPKFTKAISGTTSELKSAESALLNDVKAVGASSSKIAAIQKDFSRLNKLAVKRDSLQAQLGSPTKDTTTAYDQLAADKQAFADQVKTVADVFTSAFSLQSAGTIDTDSPRATAASARLGTQFERPGDQALVSGGYSLTQALGTLQQQVAGASQFQSQLTQLTKSGFTKTAAGKSIYQQIAELGPQQGEDELSAILGGSSSQIKQLLQGTTKLASIGGAAGKQVAQVIDGAAVTRDEGVIERLERLIKQNHADSVALAKEIVHALRSSAVDTGHAVGKQLTGVAQGGNLAARTMPVGKRH